MAVVRHFAVNLVRAAPDSPPPERSPLKRAPSPAHVSRSRPGQILAVRLTSDEGKPVAWFNPTDKAPAVLRLPL